MSKRTTEIAELLDDYVERRDTNARDLARKLNRSHAGIYWLLRGRDAKGLRYLGLGRQGGSSLLVAVARELRIPRAKVGDALLKDLGWIERTAKRRKR